MKPIVTSLAALALCACGGGSSAPLSLSVRTTAATAADPAGTGTQIDRIRLSVGRIELEGAAEAELKAGPFQVDLSGTGLDGSVQKVFDGSVPPGTYREFRFDIFSSSGPSIQVDGTSGGQPFSFTSGISVSEKKEGTFVVDAGSSNITLSVDASKWFGALDPRDEANRAAIEANIRGSFDAFQDDDRSGHENHQDDADAGDDHGGSSGGSDDGSADAGDDHGGGGGGGDDGSGHH